MIFNPLSMLTPEQQAMLKEVQKFTRFIHVTIKRDSNNLAVSLTTNNSQAEPFLPQIQQALISSVAQTLYTMFGITGKVV